MTDLCEHGYPGFFGRSERPCPYGDQLDGATLEEITSTGTFEISGRGTAYVVPVHIANKNALRGRTITIDGKPMTVTAFESCLVPGHNDGHCSCFGGSVVLAKEAE